MRTTRVSGVILTAVLGFVCGLVGLEAGLMDHTWRLGSIGWFTGGTLLTLIAVFILLDGAIAFEKTKQA